MAANQNEKGASLKPMAFDDGYAFSRATFPRRPAKLFKLYDVRLPRPSVRGFHPFRIPFEARKFSSFRFVVDPLRGGKNFIVIMKYN